MGWYPNSGVIRGLTTNYLKESNMLQSVQQIHGLGWIIWHVTTKPTPRQHVSTVKASSSIMITVRQLVKRNSPPYYEAKILYYKK
jgi:hypothetical protein